jgi:squalene-hopene/tetraprenyl-beta-curcumene cyclase
MRKGGDPLSTADAIAATHHAGMLARLRGRGHPTPSQTAWALLGYAAAGEAGSHSARRAADWLCRTQRSNGDWDEKHYTGTGFPLDFMIRYHLYRLHFPLMALGRLRERLAA